MNNPKAIGVLGPMMAERSIRDQMMQRQFGGCNGGAVENYCGTPGVGAGMMEPRTAKDVQMLKEFNTCGSRENFCGYATMPGNNDGFARINDNPYLPSQNVSYVGLQ
ncbi:MAG: hypothetical protein JSS09_05875 [Verrucomicrobia bacterium]|nr:hypothetical protein [Verrucomicrobiota bacterium]